MDELPDIKVTKFKNRKISWSIFISSILFIALISFGFFVATRPPANFPVNQTITIKPGLSALEIIEDLKQKDIIKSTNLLYAILVLNDEAGKIKAGEYVFSSPQTVFKVAYIIAGNEAKATTVNLTLPEGFTVAEYAKIASRNLANFKPEQFIQLAKNEEGFLFPDTYHVPFGFTEEELYKLLKETYKLKTEELFKASTSNLSEYEVLILASIIEREGKSQESMRLIAGILLSRLELGMPLQTDASIEYVLNKPLSQLTADDLKEIDSPYNTYLYKGLPPTPIGNPGLIAIEAVLQPKESEYLYYLTDEEGLFYYAKTYEEHQDNIDTYLK